MDNISERTVCVMESAIIYPKPCRKNILRIMGSVGVSAETAYAMMLMTAALMDLHPEDDQVAEMILEDCGLSPECA